jgi:DNA-binding CsgD family transcriptional regulator
VKVIRRNEQPHHLAHPGPALPHDLFVFYEKNSGAAHFQVTAGPDGGFPVDHAAGLLAMHCMVRGQAPSDYVVMVQAGAELVGGLHERAEQLLQAGHSAKSSVRLTRREQEVLGGILRSLANKEIAFELNLSERTVKFHVSSLLAKFKVRGRMELLRDASRHSPAPAPLPVPPAAQQIRPFPSRAHSFRRSLGRTTLMPLAKPQLMA